MRLDGFRSLTYQAGQGLAGVGAVQHRTGILFSPMQGRLQPATHPFPVLPTPNHCTDHRTLPAYPPAAPTTTQNFAIFSFLLSVSIIRPILQDSGHYSSAVATERVSLGSEKFASRPSLAGNNLQIVCLVNICPSNKSAINHISPQARRAVQRSHRETRRIHHRVGNQV